MVARLDFGSEIEGTSSSDALSVACLAEAKFKKFYTRETDREQGVWLVERSKSQNSDIQLVDRSKSQNSDVQLVDRSKSQNSDIQVVERSKSQNRDIQVVERSKSQNNDIQLVDRSKSRTSDVRLVDRPEFQTTDVLESGFSHNDMSAVSACSTQSLYSQDEGGNTTDDALNLPESDTEEVFADKLSQRQLVPEMQKDTDWQSWVAFFSPSVFMTMKNLNILPTVWHFFYFFLYASRFCKYSRKTEMTKTVRL